MLLKFLHHSANPNRKPTSLPIKVVKILVAFIIVSLALILAAVLFVYIAIGAAIVFGYIWWKTRALRKQMRSHAPSSPQPQNRLVIEGEVIRETK
jgi:O-antigen/teichoic acid export membrane protein